MVMEVMDDGDGGSVDGDDELFITSADLKDAFYHLLSPTDIRKFFGMRCASARDLGIKEIGG